MTNQLPISVVIPTYRRRTSVERLLLALARQTLPSDTYEVIVSIDGSEDGTRELVETFPAPYLLHALWQPNRGRAAACNTGVRAARGEVVVLLDDDMEPTPEFLAAHWRAHAGDARQGVIGAVPVALDRSVPPVVEYIGGKFNQHLQQLAQPGHQFKLRDFYSGNFSIRRDILLDAGLFDEAFKLYGNEDLELSLRLTKAGVRLVYSAEALAHQHYTKDFPALARDNLAKGQTAVLLAHKHPGMMDGLKLSTYRQGSRKWRALRAGLLALSDVWARMPEYVIQLMTRLEKRRPRRLNLYYTLALDYFYWLGARVALRERGGEGAVPLTKAAGKAQP